MDTDPIDSLWLLLASLSDITSRKAAESHAVFLSNHDELNKLKNR